MIRCDQSEEFMNRHTDGDLGDGEAGALFAHLSQCSNCRTYFRKLVVMRDVLHDLPTPPVPKSLDERIGTIRIAHGASRQRVLASFANVFGKTIAVPIPAAAMVLLALLTTGILLWQAGRFASRPSLPGEQTVMVLFPAIEVYAHTQPTSPALHK